MKISASWPAVPASRAREYPYLARQRRMSAGDYFLILGRGINTGQVRAVLLSDGDLYEEAEEDGFIPLESGVRVTLEQE